MTKLIILAKRLDFDKGTQYFEYCIDSYINGNFSQSEKLFKAMKKDDRKAFVKDLNNQGHPMYKEIYDFYFNLL